MIPTGAFNFLKEIEIFSTMASNSQQARLTLANFAGHLNKMYKVLVFSNKLRLHFHEVSSNDAAVCSVVLFYSKFIREEKLRKEREGGERERERERGGREREREREEGSVEKKKKDWRKGRKYPHPACRPLLPSGPNLSVFLLSLSCSLALLNAARHAQTTLQLRDFRIMYIYICPKLHRQMQCAGPKCSFPGVMNGKSDFIYSEIEEGIRPPFYVEMDFLGACKIGFVSKTIEMEKRTVLKIIQFFYYFFSRRRRAQLYFFYST